MKSPLPTLISASIVACIMLAACTLWYLFVQKTRTHVADLETQIEMKMAHAADIAKARASLVDIQGEERLMQGYFVSESEVVPFINTLQSEGRAIGAAVSVNSLSNGSVKARPTLVLSLSIGGSFDAVMRTIGAIESAPYDVVIGNISLGKTEQGDWQATVALQVGSVAQTTATKP